MLGFQMLIILVLCTFVSGDYKSGHLAACTKDPPPFPKYSTTTHIGVLSIAYTSLVIRI